MTKIALNELHPNPFRDMKRLPPKAEKVAILKESIAETSFWDNIVCRKAPNGAGGYEIAYGHNRLEALRQLKWSYVDIPVRNLDNETMAKIMARENHEEWGAYSEVDSETARAVIEAFGSGKINLPPVSIASGGGASPNCRIAPGFSISNSIAPLGTMEKVYSAKTLGDFLGWTINKTKDVLRVLAFEEEPHSKGINLIGLTTQQAAAVASQTIRVNRETENDKAATTIGKQLANEFRAGNARSTHKKDRTKRTVSVDTANVRANELMREARIKRHIAKKKAKTDALNLQSENRQVAIFLEACKDWEKAMHAATLAVGKFSPEAKKFSLRKLSAIANAEILLKGRLK